MTMELNCIELPISESVTLGLGRGCTNAMEATVRDVRAELDEDDEPRIAIKKGLFALAPLETVILDSRHVFLNAHDSLDPILLVKEPGCRGDIRQKEVDTEGPGSGSASEDQEHGLERRGQLSVWYARKYERD